MKKLAMFLMALSVMFAANGAWAGSVFIGKDYHVLKLPIDSNGYLRDWELCTPERLHYTNTGIGKWNSARVGWDALSRARGQKSLSGGYVTWVIRTTPNNDWGNWSVRRVSDGKYLAVNLDKVTFSGRIRVRQNNMIRYGNYTPARIEFYGAGNARVYFGSNLLSGLMISTNPQDVLYANWNSDRVGWGAASLATGTLQKDNLGNWFVEISGLPNNDRGNFTLRKSDGTFVWFNIDRWAYSANVSVDRTAGQISYILAP